MEEESLEDEMNQYFNDNFSGRYRTSVDIYGDGSQASAYIAFEEGSEKPGIGAFVDEIIDELGLDHPRLEADWQPEEEIYTLDIKEAEDSPMPDDHVAKTT